jgi:NitT/TauT family transport system permease protein
MTNNIRVKIKEQIRKILPPMLFFAGLLGVWQLIVSVTDIKSFLLPSPMSVFEALLNPKWQWGRQLSTTAIEIFGGFALAVFIGIFLGIVITWTNWTRRSILPFLVFLNSLPKIALAPLFIVWLGYGILPNIFIAFISAFFPVVINTAAGITEIEPDMVDLARVWQAPQWKVFLKIKIPNAQPYIFTGIKIATTMAVIGAIVGEFIASSRGLASVIMNAQATLATEAILAALIWISFVGLCLYELVSLIQWFFMPWVHKKGKKEVI